jgi:hypothetical protein
VVTFYRNYDGTIAWEAHSYFSKMLSNYETMFGYKPKAFATPLIEKDHPEIDTSGILDLLGIKHLPALQNLVT